MSATEHHIVNQSDIIRKCFFQICFDFFLVALFDNIRKTDTRHKSSILIVIFIKKPVEFFAFDSALCCHNKGCTVGIDIVHHFVGRLNGNNRQAVFFSQKVCRLCRSGVARKNNRLAIFLEHKAHDFVTSCNDFFICFVAIRIVCRVAEKEIIFVWQELDRFSQNGHSAYSRI